MESESKGSRSRSSKEGSSGSSKGSSSKKMSRSSKKMSRSSGGSRESTENRLSMERSISLSGDSKESSLGTVIKKRRKISKRELRAFLYGIRIEDVPVEELVPKHLFAFEVKGEEEEEKYSKGEFDVDKLRIWIKETQESYMSYIATRLNTVSQHVDTIQQDKHAFDDYQYPNILDFLELGEMETINSIDYGKDMARYLEDEERSDGFDVGDYPYRDAARICGSAYIFPHYKPPEIDLSEADLHTLVCLSQIAFSVYNKHQLWASDSSCNVKVLKAMKFGTYSTDLNITFQANSPDEQTFQTRVYDSLCPPHIPYSWLEIVLVRKFKGGQEDETDYLGAEMLPKFPSSMEKLSDFDENDPQMYATRCIVCSLSLPFHIYDFFYYDNLVFRYLSI